MKIPHKDLKFIFLNTIKALKETDDLPNSLEKMDLAMESLLNDKIDENKLLEKCKKDIKLFFKVEFTATDGKEKVDALQNKSNEVKPNTTKKKNIIVNKKDKPRNVRKRYKVEKIDINTGEVIKVYENPVQAAKNNNICYSAIMSVLNGRTKTSGGYFWRYIKDDIKEVIIDKTKENVEINIKEKIVIVENTIKVIKTEQNKRGRKGTEVEQIDIATNEVINTFNSMRDASIHVKCNLTSIRDVIVGSSCKCKGYFWRLKGSDKRYIGPEDKRKEDKNTVNEKCIDIEEYNERYSITDHYTIYEYQSFSDKVKSFDFNDFEDIKIKSSITTEIEQIDIKTGKVINVYPNSKEASRITKIRRSNIDTVLNPNFKLQTCGGYFWRYKGSTNVYNPPRDRKGEIRRRHEIEQIDITTGNTIATYVNMSLASRINNISKSNIKSVIIGRTKSAGGYFWRRVD